MIGRLRHLSRCDVRVRATQLLADFDLLDARDRRVATYSGGMNGGLTSPSAWSSARQLLSWTSPAPGSTRAAGASSGHRPAPGGRRGHRPAHHAVPEEADRRPTPLPARPRPDRRPGHAGQLNRASAPGGPAPASPTTPATGVRRRADDRAHGSGGAASTSPPRLRRRGLSLLRSLDAPDPGAPGSGTGQPGRRFLSLTSMDLPARMRRSWPDEMAATFGTGVIVARSVRRSRRDPEASSPR